MPTRRALIAIAISSAIATPAAAQEGREWTGFYVGGHVGYGFQPSDDGETVLFDTNLDGGFGDTVKTSGGANAFSPGFCGGSANSTAPSGGCADDRDGVEYGLQLGYDHETQGGLVLGVVGDYSRPRVRDSVSAFSTTPARYTLTRRLKAVLTLRARVGVAAGRTLFYGTGGVARGSIRNSFSTSNTANAFTDTGNDKGWGYVLGGGVEQRLGSRLSVGLQYLYRSVDAGDYVVRAGPGSAGLTNPFRIVNPNGTDFARSSERFASHGVTIAANFRF